MGNLYIGIIMLCRVAQHICNKKASNSVNGLSMIIRYSAFRQVLSATLAFILILITGGHFKADYLTIIFASVAGFMLAIGMACGLVALKNGTMALTSLFSTAGLLVPCIAGIYLFGHPMSYGQWIGIGMFFIAAYFLISSSGKIYNGFSLKTFLLLVVVMLAEGATMLSQQCFSFYVPNGNVSVFSFLTFGIMGLILIIVSLFMPKDNNPEHKLTGRLYAYGAVLSAAVFVINQLATLATAIVPPAILFTFINGGSTVIAAIVATVLFKEKLTVKSCLGVIIGVTALVIIKTF